LVFLDQSKIFSEPRHFGSNGRMSIAGYSPKNRRTMYLNSRRLRLHCRFAKLP